MESGQQTVSERTEKTADWLTFWYLPQNRTIWYMHPLPRHFFDIYDIFTKIGNLSNISLVKGLSSKQANMIWKSKIFLIYLTKMKNMITSQKKHVWIKNRNDNSSQRHFKMWMYIMCRTVDKFASLRTLRQKVWQGNRLDCLAETFISNLLKVNQFCRDFIKENHYSF